MFSINVAKLLACCKVLPSSSIILSSPCACHLKMQDEHSMDVLLDGVEPIFRCLVCGDSLCATSYMIKKLGLGQEQVYENLLMSEVTGTDANAMIYRSIKYLRLMKLLDKGRVQYRERLEADDRRHKKYGDWAEVSGREINDLFFRKSTTKVNPKSKYTILTLRDENGIPGMGYIYTMLGSFVGEVQYPIPSGHVFSVAERWSDFVSWQSKLVLAQDPALAQILSKSISGDNKNFDYPVLMPFAAKSTAKYFSRVHPKISLVLADNEEPGLGVSFHGATSPVSVYKLPGTLQTGFGISGKLEEELSRIKPQTLSRSLVSSLKQRETLTVSDLVKSMSKLGYSSSLLREEIVQDYCSISKESIEDIRASIKSFSIGFSEFVIDGKTFKLSHGKYFQRQPDLSYSCLSNFWIEIKHIISDGKKDIQYLVCLHIGNSSKEFYIDHKTFSSSLRLIRKITSVALLNGLECPTWNSTKLVQSFLPQIVRGLSGEGHAFHKKDNYGFYGKELSTDKYLCSSQGVKVREGFVGEVYQEIKHPNYLNDLPKYREASKEALRSLCETQFGAACVVCALEMICHLSDRGRAHLVAPHNIASSVASMLGLGSQEEFLPINMIQYVDKTINNKTILKHKATISLYDIGTTPNRRCIYFKQAPKEELILFADTLLLFFCEIVFVLGTARAVEHIETILQKNNRIVNFRVMRKRINGVEHTIDEFLNSIKEKDSLRKFIIEEDDNTFIDIKIFRELKTMGFSFDKMDVVGKIRQLYDSTKYPHIRRKGTHQTGILLTSPNIFNTINQDKECKMRHLSLQ